MLINFERELTLLKLVVIVELRLNIKCVFDETAFKFIFEVLVRLPVENVTHEALTKLLVMVACIVHNEISI